jgi:hypothetical protein
MSSVRSAKVPSQETTISSPKWWAIFLGFSTIEVLLIIKILTSQPSTNLLIFAGLIIILLFLLLVIDRIAKITANKDGFSFEVYEKQLNKIEENIEKKVSQAADNVKNVVSDQVSNLDGNISDILFFTLFDVYEYITLKKISGAEMNDSYSINPKGKELLERLINRALIEENNVQFIFTLMDNTVIHLREHFKLTDRGKKFMKSISDKGLGEELETISNQIKAKYTSS